MQSCHTLDYRLMRNSTDETAGTLKYVYESILSEMVWSILC